MTEIFKVTGQDDDRNISSSHFEKIDLAQRHDYVINEDEISVFAI